MRKHSEPIVLTLDQCRSARPFSEEESLWEIEIGAIMQQLKGHLENLDRNREEDPEDGKYLLSIGIFGSHGSGKSSLLKTLVSRFDDRHRKKSQGNSPSDKVYHRVWALPVIEPNLLVDDEHFLYTFLANVWHLLDEQRDEDQSPDIMSPVERTFQRIGDYLNVVDKPVDTEIDPLGYSLQRLDRHRSGPLLKQHVSNLISQLGQGLGSSAEKTLILLPVDDVDVAFDRLVSILDTCRRYLLHPQLVPVFTFTSVLAEELLRTHYATKLRVKEGGHLDSQGAEGSDLGETYSPTRLTRQMASQFLARLLPTGSRIRLRLGAARAQRADYRVSSTGDKPRPVETLLEQATILLFGQPTYPNGDRIRRVLLPATLRQQLQILEFLTQSSIPRVVPRKALNNNRDGEFTGEDLIPVAEWVNTFDRCAWGIFEVHRDVLSQLKLKVEDIYGWTRQGLRLLVLESILALPHPMRLKILQHWSLGSRDRRSQVLSLLCMHLARPAIEGSEDFLENAFVRACDRAEARERQRRDLAPDSAVYWFLNVWFSFYLPQILASKLARDKDAQTLADGSSLQAAGWDLQSGPNHAIQELLRPSVTKRRYPGTLFLDPKSFNEILRREGVSKEIKLVLLMWSNWGLHNGESWAAVSLWRALSLMGRLLEACKRLDPPTVYLKKLQQRDREPEASQPEWTDDERVAKAYRVERDRIMALLKDHCYAAQVQGLSGMSPDDKTLNLPTDPALENLIEDKEPLRSLANELFAWRQQHAHWLHDGSKLSESTGKIRPVATNWHNCFVRRLHGEYMIGHLWRDLHLTSVACESNPAENIVVETMGRLWLTMANYFYKPPGETESEKTSEPRKQALSTMRRLFLTFPPARHLLDALEIEKGDSCKDSIIEKIVGSGQWANGAVTPQDEVHALSALMPAVDAKARAPKAKARAPRAKAAKAKATETSDGSGPT